MENLMQNPSARAVNELHDMREINHMPITDRGTFLAWKRVTDDFKDFYSGTVDNSPGANPKMPRNMVCDDKEQTCERGYHFCSKEYLKDFHAHEGHIVVVEVNPKDVVSIPVDFNHTKGRCCEYKVLYEIVNDIDTPDGDDALSDELYDICDNGAAITVTPAKHNMRDTNGRFVSADSPVATNKPVMPKRDASGRFIGKNKPQPMTGKVATPTNPVKPKRDSRGRFI